MAYQTTFITGVSGALQAQIGNAPTVAAITLVSGRRYETLTAVLPYATAITVSFTGAGQQTVAVGGNITFTGADMAAGRGAVVRLVGTGSTVNYTFPTGWAFLGSIAPNQLAASKVAVLSLAAWGTAQSDVTAAYAVQP